MAAPELVIANAAYKTYPGGVIALKADEWMAGARGSLTSASDALACTGTRVRDTQTVATSIHDDVFTAYTEAADTLEIPLSALPIEIGMGYTVLISYRVPGEWDVTNPDTLKSSTNFRFAGVVALGFHGIAGSAPDEFDPMISFESAGFGALAHIPYYVTDQVGTNLGIFDAQSTDTLHVRAFAQDGVTAEWWLDQLVLLPNLHSYFGSPINGWDTPDFQLPDMFTNSTDTLGPIVDGADGGDDNGKFTWCPFPPTDRMEQGLGGGGGDYQRKDDSSGAEYFIRLDEADGEELINSTNGNEASAHAYSLHCARWPGEAAEIVNDSFSRTVTVGTGLANWEQSPEGYQWVTTGTTGMNGSVGIHRCAPSISSAGSVLGAFNDGPPTLNEAARLAVYDQFSFSGTVRHAVAPAGWDNDPGPLSDVRAWLTAGIVSDPRYSLRFNVVNTGGQTFHWDLLYFDALGTHSLTGEVDMSSWYSTGTTIGWRMEIKRYILRARVWDASGAEPSTWDYEDFRPLNATGAAGLETYPYSDDPYQAIFAYLSQIGFSVGCDFALISQTVDVHWDDIIVERDPYGDAADIGVSVEQPDGTEIDSITVPYGAAYIVYWGQRDWTEPDSGTFNLAFSSKVWNESTAAELQRAETGWFFFRSVHGAPLVSMNWRSADREGSHQRVLVGPS